MKHRLLRVALGAALLGGMPLRALLAAEESTKPLPTLLIKGEVVAVDTSDPSATLLKVKDRYGFETPILLTSATKITQGETDVQAGNIAAGTPVEVEYNFDVNTAKRHAVSVKLTVPAEAAQAPSPAAAAPAEAAPVAAPVTGPVATPMPAPVAAPEMTKAPAPAPASSETKKTPATQ